MEKREDTPKRKVRRHYEKVHAVERKENNKVWATSISRAYAEEIDEFWAKNGLTKVSLIVEGFESLKEKYKTK